MTDPRDIRPEMEETPEADVPEAEARTEPQKTLEEQCRETVCPSCAVKAEADDARLRALAEMENFKKRLQRDHDEQMRYAAESVLSDLLPALDSLDLASSTEAGRPPARTCLRA